MARQEQGGSSVWANISVRRAYEGRSRFKHKGSDRTRLSVVGTQRLTIPSRPPPPPSISTTKPPSGTRPCSTTPPAPPAPSSTPPAKAASALNNSSASKTNCRKASRAPKTPAARSSSKAASTGNRSRSPPPNSTSSTRRCSAALRTEHAAAREIALALGVLPRIAVGEQLRQAARHPRRQHLLQLGK